MDMLDGEMIMLDGMVYQARSDGQVILPGEDETIPFGTLADFHPAKVLHLAGIPDYETFEETVNRLCPEMNFPWAF